MTAIIKATILNCIRDRKNLIFMIFFPLFLVFLIGSATSNYFDKENNNVAIEDLSIYYIDEGDEKTKEVFNTFIDVVKGSKDLENIELKEISNIDEGKKEVRVNRAILLYLKNNNIEMYSNNNSSIRASIVYQIIESISDRYNAITEVYTINPLKAEEIINSDNTFNFIEEENIPYEQSPSSMDYYGVAEIGLMLFYFVSYPLFNLKHDKKNNIKDRIKLSGISTSKYYLASFIGFFIFSYGVSLITYILSNILFDVNYGNNLLIMPLAMIPFLIIVNALGTIIPIISSDDKVAVTILQNIVIPVLCFLGGGYMAMYGDMKGIFNIITKISPLRWFNNSIFRYIYSNDNSLLIDWLTFGGITLVVTVIIIYLITRREDKGNEKHISIN
ncbi:MULTISPECIES: ABC transporter permease [unclassified Clostridium]|jgi:putative ABC transporter, permease protein|uniref:ABC transporter permease n=2 Tax=Clostridium TaxID=1485 RepID=UPI0025BB397B|nr:ABC transporter permease [Clostridium sp.]MDY6228500.1 ABC transporter permease [Clostridium sp.]